MLEAQTEAPRMGAVMAELDYRALGKLMDGYSNDPENLIMILQGVQRKYNFLPEPALKYISAKLAIPLSRIYGIATFYAMFSLEPKGENIVSICLGTACHVRGAMRVKDQLEADLGITAGQTTPDAKFTLEAVRCIGCCSLGPVVNINDKTFARMDPESVIAALKDYK
jgi:NADH:ubiquinone oxidoreductase subunit E